MILSLHLSVFTARPPLGEFVPPANDSWLMEDDSSPWLMEDDASEWFME